MKRFCFLILGLALSLGCEDVIEVDVPNDKTRLAVDALIRITQDMTSTAEIKVQTRETTSFFDDITPAILTSISLLNESTGASVDLIESQPPTGLYTVDWPLDNLVNGTLLLTIEYDGEQYEARTSFVPTVPFNELKQGDGSLFSGDETEILISYTDEPNREDFYLFDFDFEQYLVSEDTFYPGQDFEFSYFYEDGLNPGQELNISILGVDETFYNYMNQLIVQSGGDQGPFQTPAATVKGNIVNLTNPENYALGFFAVCQTFSDSIIIE